MSRLTDAEIEKEVTELSGWRLEDRTIVRELELKDFAQAIELVNRVAELAEEMNHHPDISISWNKVKLSLTTHSAGGLTGNDFRLAGQIEKL